MLSNEENARKFGPIVSKAWEDEEFKNRLLADPCAVLKEHGIDWPTDVALKISENTDKAVHLALPVKPSNELEELDLENVAGGIKSFRP